MSNGISREEFNAHMESMIGAQTETRDEIRELTKSMTTLVKVTTRSEEQVSHLSHEVSEVKDELASIKRYDIKPIKEEISTLKIKASNNLLRWAFLIALTTAILGLSTWAYTTFKKPQADIEAAIEKQTDVNEAILELLKPESQP